MGPKSNPPRVARIKNFFVFDVLLSGFLLALRRLPARLSPVYVKRDKGENGQRPAISSLEIVAGPRRRRRVRRWRSRSGRSESMWSCPCSRRRWPAQSSSIGACCPRGEPWSARLGSWRRSSSFHSLLVWPAVRVTSCECTVCPMLGRRLSSRQRHLCGLFNLITLSL